MSFLSLIEKLSYAKETDTVQLNAKIVYWLADFLYSLWNECKKLYDSKQFKILKYIDKIYILS